MQAASARDASGRGAVCQGSPEDEASTTRRFIASEKILDGERRHTAQGGTMFAVGPCVVGRGGMCRNVVYRVEEGVWILRGSVETVESTILERCPGPLENLD